MTEQSDLDDNTVTQHKLPWRSESMFPKYVLSCIYVFYQILFLIFVELNKFIKKLDKKAFGSHKGGGLNLKSELKLIFLHYCLHPMLLNGLLAPAVYR